MKSMKHALEIQAFWQQWPSLRARCDHAIATGDWGTLPNEISARVDEIDPGLAWELASGAPAQHAFCLCAEEDRDLRRLTERWLQAAPPTDETWEFHPARQARPSMHLDIEGERIAPADVMVRSEIDATYERVHIQVFHEAFTRMGDGDRERIAFLAVDGVLGEDDVARWIGAFEAMDHPLDGARPLPELAAAVKALAVGWKGQKYVRVERRSGEGVIIPGSVNVALKWIDHLDFDAHATIAIPLLAGDADAAQREAGNLEVELFQAVGEGAAHIGNEMLHGNRVVHFFSTEGGAAAQRIDGFIAEHAARGIRVRWEPDPDWKTMERWL
jgi:hypothetical protein